MNTQAKNELEAGQWYKLHLTLSSKEQILLGARVNSVDLVGATTFVNLTYKYKGPGKTPPCMKTESFNAERITMFSPGFPVPDDNVKTTFWRIKTGGKASGKGKLRPEDDDTNALEFATVTAAKPAAHAEPAKLVTVLKPAIGTGVAKAAPTTVKAQPQPAVRVPPRAVSRVPSLADDDEIDLQVRKRPVLTVAAAPDDLDAATAEIDDEAEAADGLTSNNLDD